MSSSREGGDVGALDFAGGAATASAFTVPEMLRALVERATRARSSHAAHAAPGSRGEGCLLPGDSAPIQRLTHGRRRRAPWS